MMRSIQILVSEQFYFTVIYVTQNKFPIKTLILKELFTNNITFKQAKNGNTQQNTN